MLTPRSPIGKQHGLLPLMRRFARDCQGATMIVFVIAMPITIGALGLGIEIGMWFLEKRRIQEAADSGALQAAFTMRGNPTFDKSDLQTPVERAVARSGYSGTTPVVTVAPTTDFALTSDNATAVEVRLHSDHPTYFINLFGIRSIPIDARAVSMQGNTDAEACFLALGAYCPAGGGDREPIYISGGGELTLDECTMHANGSCDTSIKFDGASVTATECVSASNDIVEEGASTVNLDCNNPITGVTLDDPFEGVDPIETPDADDPLLAAGSLNDAIDPVTGKVSPPPLNASGFPMYYTAGPGNTNIGNVEFEPGVYYIKGDPKFLGSVTGTDVVLVLIGDSSIDMAGSTSVTLSAPDHDDIEASSPTGPFNVLHRPVEQFKDGLQPYAGLLVYSELDDDITGTNCKNKFVGGNTFIYTGYMYMPNTCTAFLGDGTTGSTNTCLMLIADQITVSGNNDTFASTSGCSDVVRTFGGAKTVVLVE